MHPETQYLNILSRALGSPERDTRNDNGSRSFFGVSMEFDMADGFPLLTTKRVPFRHVALELDWFLSGNTNAKWLEDRGVNIWRQWKRPYSLDRSIILVPQKKKEYVSYDGDFSAMGGCDGRGIEGSGYSLSRLWGRMMRRCYDKSHERYRFYGGVGASVCKRWHDVEAFISDVKKLPHWEYRKNHDGEFDLDKDYYGANQYGPDTSVWLREDENTLYTSASVPLYVTDALGNKTLYLSISQASRSSGWKLTSLRRYMKEGAPSCYKQGNRKFEGWSAEEALPPKGFAFRLRLMEDRDMGPIYGTQFRDQNEVDQLVKLIDGLKSDPYGRRHIISLWNPSDLPDMALPPCHGIAIQFYVEHDGRLSLSMYQRSADVFLGLPFNIASYSLMLHYVAHAVGRVAGRFLWFGGDVHLYSNHIGAAIEQLSRNPMPFPNISIDGPFDLVPTYENVKLIGYESHPIIKAEVSA